MSYVIVDLDKCMGEANCIDVCPNDVLSLDDLYGWGGKCVVNEDDCIACEACIEECSNGALSMSEE